MVKNFAEENCRKRLWFVATDGASGFEPYRLIVVETIFADGFESGDVGAWSASNG